MARLKSKPAPGATQEGWLRLRAVCRGLKFEPHNIASHLDARGRYEVELDREFPLLIKLFHYSSQQHTRGPTWHERLELFMALDGPARFRMGNGEIQLAAGDVLVVDSLLLHHVVDFPGFDTRVVVVSFMPGFVYSLGSPSYDYSFLLPFYSRQQHQPRVLRAAEPAAGEVHRAMAGLLECYFAPEARQSHRAGCKAFLLEILFHLAHRFREAEMMQWEFVRQQERSIRFKPLFDYVSQHFAEKLPIARAAALAGMSRPQFMRSFKKVAGIPFVAYHNHVRLAKAVALLKETDWSIAAIASQVGFADQSHFNRRFKASFGQSPKAFRAGKACENRPKE